MNARKLVDSLLEVDYADFSELEHPEHWEEVPYGYVATLGTDRMEAKWDAQQQAYRLTSYWRDPYTGKERALAAGNKHVTDPEAYLAQARAAYEGSGWTFQQL